MELRRVLKGFGIYIVMDDMTLGERNALMVVVTGWVDEYSYRNFFTSEIFTTVAPREIQERSSF